MRKNAFEREIPEKTGVSSRGICELIDALASPPAPEQETHSFLLIRHKKLIAEGYFAPFDENTAHTVYSVSKAFTGAAVGYCVSEGLLDIHRPVREYFPEYKVHPTLSDLTVNHLLMMGTGQVGRAEVHDTSEGQNAGLAEFFMTPSDVPHGTQFRYQNQASYVLSALVTRLTGLDLMEYLKPRLFDRLGIETPYAVRDGHGICIGYSGLRLTPEELARVGVMYLDGGVWNGERVMDEDWATETGRKQIDIPSSELGEDWASGYCRQLWRGRYNTFRFCGAYGQMCVVMPDYDAVFVTNSGYESEYLSYILDNFYNKVMLKMTDGPLPDDSDSYELLCKKCSRLSLPMSFSPSSPVAYTLDGRDIKISDRLSLKLRFSRDTVKVHISRADKPDIDFIAGLSGTVETTLADSRIIPYQTADDAVFSAYGRWTSLDTFEITAWILPSQAKLLIKVKYTGDTATAEASVIRGDSL